MTHTVPVVLRIMTQGNRRELSITVDVNGAGAGGSSFTTYGSLYGVVHLRPGTWVKIRVTQRVAGFLQLSAVSHGRVLRPNGYVHAGDAGTYEIECVVPGR